MAEVDYQLALLLQHQFEQELKKSKECSSDVTLARALQEQFQKEIEVDNPKQNLVYNEKQIKQPTKSLTDPSWEIVDPTPDIHVLFMVFNERFFWKKLLAACVSWSKRMTSCAGICSYQGRGGLCSITLSEPLLKLRPRKDLVETLLHEMIHAFLFVTHNNRDRDGHGPEFHKHMYRINAEAGTNITVYHDFHDEVRLYQQHWWRCDGPCQKWKPYFGMVRRAMNRAPGPQDRWWGEHSRNCGGNFIKVKEPEKLPKKSTKLSSKENANPKEDIRSFLPVLNTTSSRKNVSSGTTVLSNIHTITNSNDVSKISAVIPSKVNNIFGFTNLTGTNSSKGGPISNNATAAVRNNSKSNTIVIKKTQNFPKADTNTQGNQNSLSNDSGISLTHKDNSNNYDYSTVRNHWLNKYSNGNTSSNKRKLSEDSSKVQSKILRLSSNESSINNAIVENEIATQAECPICMKQVQITLIDVHVDKCLEMSNKYPDRSCIICGKNISISEYEKHVRMCTEKSFNDDTFEKIQTNECITCTFCGKDIPTKNYNSHIVTCIDTCVNNIDKPRDNVVDLTGDNLEEKQCTACDQIIVASSYDSHVEKCLLKMYDDMQVNYGSEKQGEKSAQPEQTIDCLACGKIILKSELGLHLEDCMSLSQVFDDDNEPKEEVAKDDKQDKNYNCPFCMTLVSEGEMNSHIDICLNIKESSDVETDKSIFIESLSSSEEF